MGVQIAFFSQTNKANILKSISLIFLVSRTKTNGFQAKSPIEPTSRRTIPFLIIVSVRA